jgi:hypothetical protein
MNQRPQMSSSRPTITVAGDICIDWLQFPIKAKDSGLNWELYPGTCFVAKPGGALLLADILRRFQGVTVLSSTLVGIENIPPEQVIHSNAELELFPYSSDPKDKNNLVYRVKKFRGFVGSNNVAPEFAKIENDNPDSQIVILDDAGNGFRDNAKYWPKAITENGKKPLVIYKMSRPLAQGKLWEHVFKSHSERLIVIVNADDLRSSGVNISRCLSWEKTALDFVWQMASNPKLMPFVNCSNLIVSFGLDGAIHYTRKNNGVASRLFFDPLTVEDGFKTKYPGEMQGLSSIFVAAIAAKITNSIKDKNLYDLIDEGVHSGISSARRLFKYGFGSNVNQPNFPNSGFFSEEKEQDTIANIVVPNPTVAEPADPNFWCILKEINGTQLEDIAYDIVLKGEKLALSQVPVGQFRGLKTVDRAEIESFRSISNLMREYINSENPSRPLSIAVFGSPGSGKSFGVTEVASSINPDLIVRVEFNVSQFKSPADLISALHKVRDIALEGKVPLVFFDEFDSAFESKFGWLKYFLAPMQDGKFREGETMHPIGKSIFVFAGGICDSFKEFSCELSKNQEKETAFKDAKGPDFISRLRGYVNILGPNCADGNETLFIIRRAMLLRSLLERKAKQLLDGNNCVRIDSGVLRALIKVPKFRHGARSIEAIIDMSMLNGRICWEQAFLPPKEQLRLHVEDEEMFSRLVVRDVLLGAVRETLAKAIHEKYLEDQKKNKPSTDASMQLWDNLNEYLKESNRRQADHIPQKLRKIGYGFAPVIGRKPVVIQLTEKEIEIIAELEHERWVSDLQTNGWVLNKKRNVEKKLSPYLVPWNELTDEIKEYDRQAMRAMSDFLGKVGFEIYKLR